MADDFVVGPFSKGFLRFWYPLARCLAWVLLKILGPVRIRGAYRVAGTGGVLVLCNHLSDVDPVILQYACPRPLHFMAKSELFEMKGVGWMLRRFRAFPVRRGEADRKSLRYAVDLLKAGEAVGLFPEGQLSETGELQELKAGVALIARLAAVPVICCALSGTQRMMPYGKMIPRPAFHTVDATWGDVRVFEKDTPPEEILAWAEGQLRSLLGD